MRRPAKILAGLALGASLGAGLVAGLASRPAAAEEPGLDERRARIYSQVCAHCHARPDIAPVRGDAVAWAARRARGFETLLANTVKGIGFMPALGTCGFCDEHDLRALVAFLSGLADPARAEAR